MHFSPMETTNRVRHSSLVAVSICCLGLALELTRPQSPIGWRIREAHDAVRPDYKKEFHIGKLNITEADVDVLVRTVIGEAAQEPQIGKIAVIWVIINRAKANVKWYGGNNLASVALHETTAVRSGGRVVTVWQFEPWMSRSDYLWSISKEAPIYQSVKQLVLGCINGTHNDPTDGATHFLEPNIVRSRTGGTLPKWAQGDGRSIGRHVFYKPRHPSI